MNPRSLFKLGGLSGPPRPPAMHGGGANLVEKCTDMPDKQRAAVALFEGAGPILAEHLVHRRQSAPQVGPFRAHLGHVETISHPG
jgi:hypothetical protein